MSYTGQPLKRVEDPRLITGRGSFVDDIHLPDMLYAAVLRSPHAHARIKAIDVSAARHSPGVVTVLTGEDIAGVLSHRRHLCRHGRAVQRWCAAHRQPR